MLPLPSTGQCHYTVAFSPDGRWLAAGGSAQAVDIWDLHAPQEAARRWIPFGTPLLRVQFTPEGCLVMVTPNIWRVIEPQDGTLVTARPLIGNLWQPASGLLRATVAPDGATIIFFVDRLQRCAVAGQSTGLDWRCNDDTSNWIADGAIADSERLIAVGARMSEPNGFLQVRDTANGHIIDTIPANGRPFRVACSEGGELAAILANGHLSVWHIPTRTAIVERTGAAHGGWLSVTFDPHGKRIVTGGIDSTVAVWDATGGPPLKTFQWGVGPVYAVTFDRDGFRAAAAGHSGAIVWDVDE